MTERNRRHILIPTQAHVESYSPHPRKITVPERPTLPNRRQHSANLKRSFRTALAEANTRRAAHGIEIDGATAGVFVQFESLPNVELDLPRLENQKKQIELVAVTQTDRAHRATVFVPEKSASHFQQRFDEYGTQETKKGKPKHKELVERIADLRLADLESLWTEATIKFPEKTETVWWEVWLRRSDDRELERLRAFAAAINAEIGERPLAFQDRIATVMHTSAAQLSQAVDVLSDLAEIRAANESVEDFVRMESYRQVEWIDELRTRLTAPEATAPSVCILDTGVNRGHPLLEASLEDADLHACEPGWNVHDHDGHGTEMAALALFGNLAHPLLGSHPVQVPHRLESVKILPPPPWPDNRVELYGAVTADAVHRVEIQAADRSRSFSMSVNARKADLGQPTSWSAGIDALAAGRSFVPRNGQLVYLDHEADLRRLFVVSAGNNREPNADDHLADSDTHPVRDPAQAWNVLTVGAYTELSDPELIADSHPGWTPVAPNGELSPYSTTSVGFEGAWPIKPDVVAEGGNTVVSAAGEVDFPVDALSLLTAYHRPAERLLTSTNATSAATAQVSRIAGILLSTYPDYWPETVRGLIVHSAVWTEQMEGRLNGATGKRDREALVRRYGYGVATEERALHSAGNALTVVAQESIRPFVDGKMCEMKLHDLPWPKAELEALADDTVRLRVTLSYFVEPNEKRLGWKQRYRYASHGLRFDVKSPTETVDEFRKRLNKQALAENEQKPGHDSDSSQWFLGEQARSKGSLHSDIWKGSAADLAERGVVAVYPVSGWWKDVPKRDRGQLGARYSLILSIETDDTNVDLWTPVAQQVGVSIPV